MIAMDYFTKWPITEALKEATAKAVSSFVYRKIICEHECPEILQSNKGIHFVNRVIQDLTEKFRIKHRLSSLYYLQTNGLVKRFNQTLYEKLAKVADESDNWDEFIEPTLIAYHITKHSIIGVTLFVFVYGREAVIPIDETLSMMIRDRMLQIIEEVPYIREQACFMI